MTLLNIAWVAINALEIIVLALIFFGVLWFIRACADARTTDERVEHVWSHPSNVTLLPRPRPFDHEVDA